MKGLKIGFLLETYFLTLAFYLHLRTHVLSVFHVINSYLILVFPFSVFALLFILFSLLSLCWSAVGNCLDVLSQIEFS